MNQWLKERKRIKHAETVDFYSAIVLIVILAVIVAVLEVIWVIKLF